jgi:D-arginine dehydrogenase
MGLPVSDFLVVGAGIAGAAAGHFLSRHGSVTVLEAEDAPGRHATGRSAAVFSEYYGNTVVRDLTTASRAFFTRPPDGFSDVPLLNPRGVLVACPPGSDEACRRALAIGRTVPGGIRELNASAAREYWPELRVERYERFLLRTAVCDIDVAAVHQGFLRGLKVVSRARVNAVEFGSGLWQVETSAGRFEAPVLVNAAGAWADELAGLAGVAPLGLVARRRTAALTPVSAGLIGRQRTASDSAQGAVTPPGRRTTREGATRESAMREGVARGGQGPVPAWPGGHGFADRPMLIDLAETFYAKPESGGLLISPADATPMPPGDVRPDELDVATAAARLEEATTLTVRRISHSWAGLRSSVADDIPVVGAAPDAPGFFWHTGFGGYGVQLSAAAGQLLASAVAGRPDRPELSASLSPSRLPMMHDA